MWHLSPRSPYHQRDFAKEEAPRERGGQGGGQGLYPGHQVLPLGIYAEHEGGQIHNLLGSNEEEAEAQES